MMTCKDIEGKLTAYQEGVLSPEEKRLVESHLKICSQCSSSLEDLKITINLLKDLPEVEPPPWFTQKVMAQVSEASEQKHGLLKKLFYPFHIKIPIEAFATLLVATIGIYIYQSTLPESRTVVQVPQGEIQQTIPHADPTQETKITVKDSTETKNRSNFVAIPSREKAYEPVPPAEKLTATEQQQKPAAVAATAPSTTTIMESEKKQEDIHESAQPRQEPATPPAPMARQKEAPGAAGASQKDASELKKLETPRASKPALGEKQAITTLSVHVTDVQAAIHEIEQILAKLGGRSISRESREGKEFINARLQSDGIEEFLRQLRAVGVVKERKTREKSDEVNALLRIEITTNNASR